MASERDRGALVRTTLERTGDVIHQPHTSTVAIIGNGCASAECFRALRENGYRGEIDLFADTTWPIYNPMLTTYYVAGKIGFDGLFPFGNNGRLYERYRVNVHSGSPVVSLDAEERTIVNRAGLALRYDQCLIASGASPFMPPIEGIGSDRVYTMRTIEDAVRLREALALKPRKALVVGASMVGIKLVECFHQAGMAVCLADLAEHVFPTAAHPECAALIEERLAEKGVQLRLGAGIRKITETREGIRAYFGDGDQYEEADMLAVCIGVRANAAFVDRTQVAVDQGILVDEQMQTNYPGLYAAGDVAQGKDLLTGEQHVVGSLANARYQGRTAGRNMAGAGGTSPGYIPNCITHFMGTDFVGIGSVSGYSRMEKRSDGGQFIQLFWQDGLLVGANLLDAFTEAGVVKNALLKRLVQGMPPTSHAIPLCVARDSLVERVLMEVERL